MPLVECPVCESTDYFTRDGLQFCSVCQTQSQELGYETVVDDETMGRFGANESRLDQLNLKKARKKKAKKEEKVTRWTSAEAFSHILVAWIKEVNKIGDIDVKEVANDTWIKYLSCVGVAFCPQKERGLGDNPCYRDRWLASGLGHKVVNVRSLNKALRDRTKPEVETPESDSDDESEIETREQRKKRRKKRREFLKSMSEGSVSEVPQSSRQSTSQSEGDSSWVTTDSETETDESGASTCSNLSLSDKSVIMERSRHKMGVREKFQSKELPTHISLNQLVYCLTLSVVGRPHAALTTADMAYLFNKDILSYRSAVRNLPTDYKVLPNEVSMYYGKTTFSEGKICRGVYRLASFIGLGNVVLSTPTTMKIILSNYLLEMSLPSSICQDIVSAVEMSHMLSLQYPVDKYDPSVTKWGKKQLPSVAARALALILLHLKFHFGLDDQYEELASHNARKFNMSGDKEGEEPAFDFIDWLRLSKLRLDLMMTREVSFREQFRDLAHVGTGDLTAEAAEREARINDERMCPRGDGSQSLVKMEQLVKLIEQLKPEGIEKEEWCELGLLPLHTWTTFHVSKQYLDERSRNHLSSLLECQQHTLDIHHSFVHSIVRKVAGEEEDVTHVELAKNWVDISDIDVKPNRNVYKCEECNRIIKPKTEPKRDGIIHYREIATYHWRTKNHTVWVHSDRRGPYILGTFHDSKNRPKVYKNWRIEENEARKDEGIGEVTCPKVEDSYANVRRIYWMNHHESLLQGKLPLFQEHNVKSRFVEANTTNDPPGKLNFLATFPSNFRWILQYFALHAHLDYIDLYRELIMIEKFLLAYDGEYFGGHVAGRSVPVYRQNYQKTGKSSVFRSREEIRQNLDY